MSTKNQKDHLNHLKPEDSSWAGLPGGKNICLSLSCMRLPYTGQVTALSGCPRRIETLGEQQWKGQLSLYTTLMTFCNALQTGRQRQQSASTVYMYSTYQWEAGTGKLIFCSQIFLPSSCTNIHYLSQNPLYFASTLSQSLQRCVGAHVVATSLLPVFISWQMSGSKNYTYMCIYTYIYICVCVTVAWLEQIWLKNILFLNACMQLFRRV